MRGQCKGAVLAEVLVALLLLLPAASRVGATQHHHGLRDQLLLSTIEAAQAAADAAAPCEGISCFRQVSVGSATSTSCCCCCGRRLTPPPPPRSVRR